jgi:Uma2 family endonuclease
MTRKVYVLSLDTLQEYYRSKSAHVIQHSRTETGQWLLTEHRGETANLSLTAIAFDLDLAELYSGVEFDRSDAD